MTTTKKIPIKNLFAIIGIYLFWAIFTLLSYRQINKNLSDYTLITGVVDNVETVILNSKKGTNAIAISLNNSQTRFGFQNKYRSYYDALKKQDILGKEVAVYYNSSGAYVADNLTLWIGQLEIENEIFFPLDAHKDYESVGLKIQLIFLVLMTLFVTYVGYQYIKERTPRANPRFKQQL